eukprot:g52185.t1
MGEPEELVEGVGEINLNPAPAGFWKPWGEIEEKAPAEMKNPKLVRTLHCVCVCGDFLARMYRETIKHIYFELECSL